METNNENVNVSVNNLNRESLLKTNSEIIENIKKRLSGKRFKAMENENYRLAYYRILLQALQGYNMILRDSEYADIKKRLEALENAQSQGG